MSTSAVTERTVLDCWVCMARAPGTPRVQGAVRGWVIEPHVSALNGLFECHGTRYVCHKPADLSVPATLPWCNRCRHSIRFEDLGRHRRACAA